LSFAFGSGGYSFPADTPQGLSALGVTHLLAPGAAPLCIIESP